MHSTMSASHPSPVKDGRRVLGEKHANACLSPAHHRHASVSPLKQQRSLLETSSSPKKLLPSPLFAGQKRSIDQVDSTSEPQISHASAQPQSRPEASPNVQHDVQQDSQPHATPETPTQLLESQQHQPQEDTHSDQTTTPTTTTPLIPEDPATRKRFIQEKATLLRTRLQTAMRHIQDPQLDRRLSDLEAHSRKYPRLSLPQEQRINITTPTSSTSSSSQNQNQTTPRPYQPTTHLPLHETETQNASGLSSPPLSTGTIATQKEQEQDTQTPTQRAEDDDNDDDPMRTPTQKSTTHHNHTHRRTNTLGSPMQLSSPPATVSRCRSTEIGKDMDMGEDEEPQERQRRLSQKGDAVDGLLKLMGTGEGAGTGVA
ncbi:hypothetical protein AtubIFM56815_002374 [Aspergillus tubingensis]|uniref:Uncharacterized protein n=2 Tax=Aspergillus subgen. Circumdati TaxID=2720871 RepID=A0A8H3SRR5_ASPTU|nr:heterokaryon incompatibility protein (HET) family protein [Aspergillus tubingensis]GAQ36373.1 similar to An02g06740 [Aspergillus niger]GFN14484.1 heterokaryon incompatibility protein (HET) family protein [Aspergillus tubingensis]GLA87941.1 hypothetical protein AtubIFM56815_002374 [Aspergillus tubingensis]